MASVFKGLNVKIDAVSVWIGGYIMRIQAANTFYIGTYSVLNTKSSFPYAVKVEGYGNTRNQRSLFQFENAGSSWYFRRNSPQNEVKTQDKAQMFDTKYQKTAVSIMEQAKEKFLVAFKSINYKQGTATSILSDIMKKC